MNSTRRTCVQAAVFAAAVVMCFAALAGCTGATGGSGTMNVKPGDPSMAAPEGGANMATTASTTTTDGAQACSNCAGKGMAPTVAGATVDEGGVQVIKIGIKDGYYTPNRFVVKAGTPVKVTFSGSAKGCLANPTFKTLGKKADFTSGAATLDLGALAAGSYDFTCGMGMVGGRIVAQ